MEFELQQELQRFTTQFTDRVTQATETLEQSPRARTRDEALRKNLLYVSSAMEIATGQFAEVNLLDMVVFVRLSRTILDKHWIPTLYGAEGDDLGEVFARSDQELSQLAARVLTPEQRQELARLIDAWLVDNPHQVRVEGIRLADFSAAAGSAAERATQASGLLASVKTATRTANQALLLSERGLFLLQRLPFLWRLQARLAARELINDMQVRLSLPRLVRRGAIVAGLLGAAGVFVMWRASRR